MVRNLNDTNKKQSYNLMFKKPRSTSVYNYLSGLYFVQPQRRLENLESWKHECINLLWNYFSLCFDVFQGAFSVLYVCVIKKFAIYVFMCIRKLSI